MISLFKNVVIRFSSAHIAKHSDHSFARFLARTVSAQLHAFGFVLALGISTLLLFALLSHASHVELRHLFAAVLFCIAGLLVFASSSLLHFLADGFRISKPFFRTLRFLDHASIYLFIAACYTVFIINTVKAPWDSIILAVVWSTAAVGLCYTAFKSVLPRSLQNRWVSTGIFLALGWTILLRLPEAWQSLDTIERTLLCLGGFFYTAGAAVYASRRPNPIPKVFGHHEIWHLAVLFGYVSHSAMVLAFYRP